MTRTDTPSQELLLALPPRRNIYDLSPDALKLLLAEWQQPGYRAEQILRWLYREFAYDFEQMTNLPVALRAQLSKTFVIGSAELVAQKISSDGWTRKVLLKMHDGNTIEAVLMLYYDRATVCVSSQVGCAMGCTFCATGQMGFTRNLTAGEILEQVIWFNRWLRTHPHTPPRAGGRKRVYAGHRAATGATYPSGPATPSLDEAWHIAGRGPSGKARPWEITAVTNIVFMGMGEPLVNYNNLWRAIRTIATPQGMGMSPRRLTVSTVGIAPQIERFAMEELAVNLAVSLHSPDDELRSSMMPMNTRYAIADLIAACRRYVQESHRRITFEYVLIKGTNDSLDMAARLAALLEGMLCHVNLIPLNPVPGTSMFATPREQVFAFQKVIEDAGISTTVRIERGVDIAAACGQLKVEEEPGSRRRTLNPELVNAHVQADLAAST